MSTRLRPSWCGLRPYLVFLAGQTGSSLGSAMAGFALIVWVYQRAGTAMSVTALTACTYLPALALALVGGALADRWDKRRVLLVTTVMAACGTGVVLGLHLAGGLAVWHVYLVNVVLSLTGAFANPAGAVATSLLVPRAQYARASGLASFGGAAVSIVAAPLATALLAWRGLTTVLVADLGGYLLALAVLLAFVRIPVIPGAAVSDEPLAARVGTGLAFLRARPPLLRLILTFSLINLLAYLGTYALLAPLVLARTGGDRTALGLVTAAEGVAALLGAVLVTLAPAPRRRVRTIFVACAVSFALCEPLLGLGRTPWVWALAMAGGALPLPFVHASLSVILRTAIPVDLQGRVFAARDTLQFGTIPAGLFLGGLLSDHLLEPLMGGSSTLALALSHLVGTGPGAGMACLFLLTGTGGVVVSVLGLRSGVLRQLDGVASCRGYGTRISRWGSVRPGMEPLGVWETTQAPKCS